MIQENSSEQGNVRCDDRVPLWEIEHPYYCEEGCFFEPGCHEYHGSWSDFLATMGYRDGELNLLFRWDWKSTGGHDRLLLFFVAQRKGYTFSHEVDVRREDEPSVHDWLLRRREHIDALWEGVGR